MSNVIGARAPGWLRVVAALALLWNLVGVWSYLGSVGLVPPMDDMGDEAMPTWVTGAFAISVFAGALGSLALLMLSRWAKALLVLSLLALLAQDVWAFVLRDAAPSAGTTRSRR